MADCREDIQTVISSLLRIVLAKVEGQPANLILERMAEAANWLSREKGKYISHLNYDACKINSALQYLCIYAPYWINEVTPLNLPSIESYNCELWIKLVQKMHQDQFRFISNKLMQYRFENILDMGGGLGYFLIEMLKGSLGARGTIFEIEPIVSYAKRNIKKRQLEEYISVQEVDISNDIMRHEVFDLIVLSNVFHLIPKVRRNIVINNIAKLLERGGCVLIFEPFISKESNAKENVNLWFDVNVLIRTNGHGGLLSKNELDMYMNNYKFQNKITIDIDDILDPLGRKYSAILYHRTKLN